MRIEEGEEEVEGIGDAVGKATEDEDGNTEEEGEHLTLAGELDGGGHDETATDGKKETGPGTFRQATGEDLGGWLDAVGLGIGDEPCGEEQPTILPKRTTASMDQSPLRRMKPAVPV